MASLVYHTAAGGPLQLTNSKGFGDLLLRHRPAALVARNRRRCISVPTRAAVNSFPLPSEYGYVVLTAAASAVLVQWQAFQVAAQRKRAGIQYPKMYEDADPSLFNCYQRAHQNTLESYPAFLGLLAIGGLGYPVISSAFGLLWVVGRIVYSLGYYTGDPKNRLKGMFQFFGYLGLLGTTTVFGIQLTGVLSLLKSS